MTATSQDALLLALGGLIRKELSAPQMLERFVDVMVGHLQADRGTVFLLDESGTELVSIAAHLPELQEIRVPLTQGVAGHVARTGQIANIPNGKQALPIWREIDQQTGYTTHSMLAGPLYDRSNHLIGVIQLLNKKTGTFGPEDEEIFIALSAQTATLLEETTLSRCPNYLDMGKERPPFKPQTPSVLLIGDRFNRIVGSSEPMRKVFKQIHRVASTDAGVLLRGESGTGKGLIARAIHHNSARRDASIIHVDCTTLPDGLMENELFGHERGAYTGAHTRSKGKIEAAQGGTLFLDEIGDLPLQLQGKLLTLLQEKTYRRVGGTRLQHADIRIITATNRPLEHLVQKGQFREDLYYRLRVVQITLPPLRQRGKEDLLRLINHFVAEASRRHKRPIHHIRQDALEMLLSYQWPGNVRELENCLESAVIFSDDEIVPSALPLARPHIIMEQPVFQTFQQPNHMPYPTPPPYSSTPLPPSMLTNEPKERTQTGLTLPLDTTTTKQSPFGTEPSLRELEALYIQFLLDKHDGNRSACARILGIGRNTLLRKMKENDLVG